MSLQTIYEFLVSFFTSIVHMLSSVAPFSDLPELNLFSLMLAYLMTNLIFHLFIDDFTGDSDDSDN